MLVAIINQVTQVIGGKVVLENIFIKTQICYLAACLVVLVHLKATESQKFPINSFRIVLQ